jgi:hypothetical protein
MAQLGDDKMEAAVTVSATVEVRVRGGWTGSFSLDEIDREARKDALEELRRTLPADIFSVRDVRIQRVTIRRDGEQ